MLHTLLIAAAIIGSLAAIVGFLIFITKRQTRQRDEQLRKNYQDLLTQHSLHPDFSQTFDHRILAVDASRQVFVFVQHDESLPSAVIDLKEVSSCQIWKDGIQISRRGSASVEEYVSLIGLSFTRKNGEVTNVPVYTEALDGAGEKIGLSKAADQWLQRLKALSAGNPGQRRMIA